jgi:bifunctional non-homologous end joining protein LigD
MPPGIEISHPDKVLFPDDGITKGELAAYYAAVAACMLPHIVNRPVTMERYPNGLHGQGFLQKDVSKGFPEWLQRVEAPKRGGTVHYPLVTDARSLQWLANQNCITPHLWVSREPELYQPDVCVFDLDPSDDEVPKVLRATALALRELLDEIGLMAWVKTSGSKGFHIVVPLDGQTRMEQAAAFALGVAEVLVSRDPRHLTLEFGRAERGGRILIDTRRNDWAATFAAAYAVRARAGAPVSAPCTWDEVESGAVGPQTFNLRSMQARIDQVGELWSELPRHARSLGPAAGRLERLRAGDGQG